MIIFYILMVALAVLALVSVPLLYVAAALENLAAAVRESTRSERRESDRDDWWRGES